MPLRAARACPCHTTGFPRSYLAHLKVYSVVLGRASPLPSFPIGRTSENLWHNRTRYEARPSTTAARPSPSLIRMFYVASKQHGTKHRESRAGQQTGCLEVSTIGMRKCSKIHKLLNVRPLLFTLF